MDENDCPLKIYCKDADTEDSPKKYCGIPYIKKAMGRCFVKRGMTASEALDEAYKILRDK